MHSADETEPLQCPEPTRQVSPFYGSAHLSTRVRGFSSRAMEKAVPATGLKTEEQEWYLVVVLVVSGVGVHGCG